MGSFNESTSAEREFFVTQVLGIVLGAEKVAEYEGGAIDHVQAARYRILRDALRAGNLPSSWLDIGDVLQRDIDLYARGLADFLYEAGYLIRDQTTGDPLLTATIVEGYNTQVRDGMDNRLSQLLEHFSHRWSIAPDLNSPISRDKEGKVRLAKQICRACRINPGTVSVGFINAICTAFAPCDDLVVKELLNDTGFIARLRTHISAPGWFGRRVGFEFKDFSGFTQREALRSLVLAKLPYGTYPQPGRCSLSSSSMNAVMVSRSKTEAKQPTSGVSKSHGVLVTPPKEATLEMAR